MMKRIALALAFTLALAASAVAQSFPQPATTNQIAIAGTIGGPTQVVAAIAGRQIIVTSMVFTPAVAGATVQLTYGTGTNCATGNTALTGVMVLASPLMIGDGSGGIIVVPQNQNLCITIAAQTAPGFLAYDMYAQ